MSTDTTLLKAVVDGDSERAHALIDAGHFDPSELSANGCGSLWFACRNASLDDSVGLHLIDHLRSADSDDKEDGVDFNATDKSNMSALLWACRNGRAAVALALLSIPRVLTNKTWIFNGTTALWWSCKRGMSGVAIEILSRSAIDVHAADSTTGKSTLDVARASHDKGALDGAVLKRLVELGARHSGAALLAACRESDSRAALRILDAQGVDMAATDASTADERNALWYAVRHSMAPVALRMLEIAAAVRTQQRVTLQLPDLPVAAAARDAAGRDAAGRGGAWRGLGLRLSMVMRAKARRSQATIARRSLARPLARLDVNATHTDGTTPLWWACERRAGPDLSAVALALLETPGIVVNGVDEVNSITALFWACYWSHAAVAMKLLTSRAFEAIDVNVRRRGTGTTALLWACRNGLEDVAIRLLRRPALLAAEHHEVDSVDVNAQVRSSFFVCFSILFFTHLFFVSIYSFVSSHTNAKCARSHTTALWHACNTGLKKVAMLILDYDRRTPSAAGRACADPRGGVDVDVDAKHRESGLSTLDIARARNGWSDVDERLVAMGARHDGAALLSALRAPENATSTALALLATDGIDVTETDEEGRTTLHIACLNACVNNAVIPRPFLRPHRCAG